MVSSLGIALATVAACMLAGRTLSIRFATREGLYERYWSSCS